MSSPPYVAGPFLLADIGGTNARFALDYDCGRIDEICTLSCTDYDDIVLAIRDYLARCPEVSIRHAIIAIANPVSGDIVKMTNHYWEFSIEAVRQKLNFETLLVVNDFAALARAVPVLKPEHIEKVGGGSAQSQGVIGLVGAGTGLGVAGLVQAGGRWLALESEGGHVSFSPTDERELAVLQYCWQRFEHVSAERLVSGPGIELIYEALFAQKSASVPTKLDTATIVSRGLSGIDPLCRETIECFCGMLGTVAANVAVTFCARGGIYIGGGVVPRLGSYFAASPFRHRFESTGRFSGFHAQIPTLVITTPYPAFLGVAAILTEHLAEHIGSNSANTLTMSPLLPETKEGAVMHG